MYDLAGYARNIPDGTVSVSLQGDKSRIDRVLDAIRAGSKKSSTDNKVSVADDALDPNLKTFTVFAWTSTTRNITNPYDLVFSFGLPMTRSPKKRPQAAWNTIAESTLKGDDLAKFMNTLMRTIEGRDYPPMREKMSRKGAPPQAEVTKSL